MKQMDKIAIEQRRRTLSLKSMHFNRFLFVRYMTAAFFFGFLNWSCLMLLIGSYSALVPIALALVCISAVIEQIRLYSTPTENVPFTKFCFKTLLFAQSLLFVSLFTPLYHALFPFLNEQFKTKSVIALLLILGMVICHLVLVKLDNIAARRDKQYQYVMAMTNQFSQEGN